MPLELLFLGTGTSAGIPMIGCDCQVCRSHDPRDQRTRPSVMIRYPDLTAQDTPATRQYLIDTPPELRIQMIRHRIDRIDGVLFTHTHADHVFGLDDMRRFNVVMRTSLPAYADQNSLDAARKMFSYVFEPEKHSFDNTFVPNLIPQLLEAGKAIDLGGARWTPVRLLHGRRPILGFRIDYPATGEDEPGGSLAYCTDVSSIPPETYPLLEDLDVLVIDALRYRHHPTHMTVDQALGAVEQIKPRRAYFTHIAHDIQHADLESRLPEHVYLAFDGLTLDVRHPASASQTSHPDPSI